jgi:hypothetical protein
MFVPIGNMHNCVAWAPPRRNSTFDSMETSACKCEQVQYWFSWSGRMKDTMSTLRHMESKLVWNLRHHRSVSAYVSTID